jgi:hypothetical protein
VLELGELVRAVEVKVVRDNSEVCVVERVVCD